MNNTNIIALFTIFVLTALLSLQSVGQVILDNGSFEDTPADATMPSGWWAVSPGTTPDILPGFWGVYLDASDGETYIGLITRENGTYEGIGQRLSQTLKQDYCYSFTIDLAYSAGYVGYNLPIKLRIYLGDKRKSKEQLIYESETIEHFDWETYPIEFSPKEDYRYLIIEVYSPSDSNVGGNILIDNITTVMNCNRA